MKCITLFSDLKIWELSSTVMDLLADKSKLCSKFSTMLAVLEFPPTSWDRNIDGVLRLWVCDCVVSSRGAPPPIFLLHASLHFCRQRGVLQYLQTGAACSGQPGRGFHHGTNSYTTEDPTSRERIERLICKFWCFSPAIMMSQDSRFVAGPRGLVIKCHSWWRFIIYL